MYKAILFDLDGTLLPMDQETFTAAYFAALSENLSALGYAPKTLLGGVRKGLEAMVNNRGDQTNEAVFWQAFSGYAGEQILSDKARFDAFYETEFDGLCRICGKNEEAGPTVKALKARGYRLVLASNPVFPAVAQKARMRWAGVDPADFEWITAYENAHYCKPNVLYYREIATALALSPEDCLMVGNDVREDMVAAEIGMGVFLMPEFLLNRDKKSINPYPRGSFSQLTAFIEKSAEGCGQAPKQNGGSV